MIRTAILSDDRRYRYVLFRHWGEEGEKRLQWIMLNPSTGDALDDDPTIRKCIGFAQRLGYAGIEILNLFAFRSSRPDDLLEEPDPYGPENNRYLIDGLNAYPGEPVVLAWGSWFVEVNTRRRGAGIARVNVEGILRGSSRQAMCLGLTKNGSPRHPARLPYSTPLVPYET